MLLFPQHQKPSLVPTSHQLLSHFCPCPSHLLRRVVLTCGPEFLSSASLSDPVQSVFHPRHCTAIAIDKDTKDLPAVQSSDHSSPLLHHQRWTHAIAPSFRRHCLGFQDTTHSWFPWDRAQSVLCLESFGDLFPSCGLEYQPNVDGSQFYFSSLDLSPDSGLMYPIAYLTSRNTSSLPCPNPES